MPLDNAQREEVHRMLEVKKENLLDSTDSGTTNKKSKKKKKTKTSKKKKNPIEAAILNELNEVEAALKRLKEHEHRFGYCEHCFMEIPWGELVHNPARRFCSRCS